MTDALPGAGILIVGEGKRERGQEAYGRTQEISVPSSQVCCESKNALKIKSSKRNIEFINQKNIEFIHQKKTLVRSIEHELIAVGRKERES